MYSDSRKYSYLLYACSKVYNLAQWVGGCEFDVGLVVLLWAAGRAACRIYRRARRW